MLGALLFCVLFRRILGNSVGMAGYTVFACVFLSCPFISEVWVYYFHNGVDLGYVLMALSLLLLLSGFEKTGRASWKDFMGSMLLLCTAAGCYESFLILYLTGAAVILFFQGMMGKKEKSGPMVRKLIIIAGLALGCILLRTVIRETVIAVFSLQDMGEIAASREAASGLRIFGDENWLGNIFMLLKRYWLVYFVNGAIYFPIAVYVMSLAVFGTASVVLTIRKKSGWYLLLALGMTLLPMTLSFVVMSAPLYRACQYMPFFTASAMLLLYLFLKKWQNKYGIILFAALSALLVWNQAFESNRSFYTDYLKYEHDKEVLISIAREVTKEYGGNAKVIFTGEYRVPYELVKDYYAGYSSEEFRKISTLTDWLDPHLKEKYYSPYGYSFAGEAQYSVIEWGLYAFDHPGRELGRFLRMHGYDLQVAEDRALTERADAFAEGMGSWPEEGAVAEWEGYVIVNF